LEDYPLYLRVKGKLMAIEQTFTILKPGALQRRLVGEIISRFETKGFRILAMKTMCIPTNTAEIHYQEHKGKAFYEPLIQYMTSDPVVIMILERENAIDSLRKLAGSTDPDNAEPGTIRGDYGVRTQKNIVHASDSQESASREIEIFFEKEEIIDYTDSLKEWY
jgi:nucleoside-diphosphate kinase